MPDEKVKNSKPNDEVIPHYLYFLGTKLAYHLPLNLTQKRIIKNKAKNHQYPRKKSFLKGLRRDKK